MELSAEQLQQIRQARREYNRQWRAANKERIREYNKQWRRAHPDRLKEYNQRYWLKTIEQSDMIKKGYPGQKSDISEHDKKALIVRQRWN